MSDDKFDFRRFPTGPKKPPPAHGIRMKKAGTTWWGRRWIEALTQVSEDYASRLSRGRTYARTGRVHDLVVQHGAVLAKVTGSRAKPYAVEILISALGDASWNKALERMSSEALFAARLLSEEMPENIDDAFRKAGTTLFPVREGDLTTRCSCPDWANPCKHVAATHYILGEAFDRDPFLLFQLRGRSKKQILSELERRRANQLGTARRTRAKSAPRETMKPTRVTEDEYESPALPMPQLGFVLQPPSVVAPVLRQLGAPAGWTLELSPADFFSTIIQKASERAVAIATQTCADESTPAEEQQPAHASKKSRRSRRR